MAAALGTTRATVGKWRRRILASSCDALLAEPRPGTPRTVSDEDVERVGTLTLESLPRGATQWSTRSMAEASGLSRTTVSRIWRAISRSSQPLLASLPTPLTTAVPSVLLRNRHFGRPACQFRELQLSGGDNISCAEFVALPSLEAQPGASLRDQPANCTTLYARTCQLVKHKCRVA